MKTKSANVKVMLSYDYCHFEVSKLIEVDENGELSNLDIDNARKDCQRLADKAVGQYKKAKSAESDRINAAYDAEKFKSQCLLIQAKKPDDRTIKEIAMLKTFEDEKWMEQYKYSYNYDDDEDYTF